MELEPHDRDLIIIRWFETTPYLMTKGERRFRLECDIDASSQSMTEWYKGKKEDSDH